MGVLKNGVGRPSNETIKKRNIFKILCLVLFIAVIGLVAYILNDKGIIKTNKKTEKTDKKVVKNESKDDGWYEPDGTAKTIDIYFYKDSSDYKTILSGESYEEMKKYNSSISYEKKGSYKCTSESCKLVTGTVEDEETAVFLDNDFIVYNYKTNKAKKIDFGNYKVDYLKKIKLSTGGLGEVSVIPYCAGSQKYYSFTVYTSISKESLGFINSNLKAIAFVEDSEVEISADLYGEFNTTFENYDFLDNGNLIYSLDDKLYTYDYKKDKIKEGNQYNDVVGFSEGYIMVVDNDKYLKILDENEKVLSKIVKIRDYMTIHSSLSGWYEQDKKKGIYVVVQDSTVQLSDLSAELQKELNYDSTASFGYEYYYIPSTNETGKIATYIGGYAKPILYLYPENDNTKVEVTFEKPELLTTTYPKYKNSWIVTANKNGDLYDENGKYYYGLYWDEKGSINVKFNEGFYVTKDNAIEFLEEKLTKIGLNDKERNEFIMYWLPILEKNEKNLVYFELTSSRESYNKLNINPKPDSLLRVAIHIKKVNKKQTIKEQKLPTFERKGFTAVEWGGVVH